MDAEYLKVAVGPAVVEGLSVILQSNPRDPIEFLGQFLIHHAAGKPNQAPIKSAAGAQPASSH